MKANGTSDVVRGMTTRGAVAARLLVLAFVLFAAIGVVGHFVHLTLLASALGPTAYMVFTQPDSVTARVRNGVIGHAVAVAWALAALAVFGLWQHPSVAQQGHATLWQVAASAIALGLTLATLELLDAHHAPAAATTLLITTGIAHPGRPLYGLLIGLAAVLVCAPPLTRLAPGRRATTRIHE